MREGRPTRCVNSLSQDTISEVRDSAFTRRTFFHRFIKEHSTMEERTFYRVMMGAPARDEYIRDIEAAVDMYIRDPKIVLDYVLAEMESGASHINLTLGQSGALLVLRKAL